MCDLGSYLSPLILRLYFYLNFLFFLGIGHVMVRAQSRNGATVYILGRRLDKLISAANSINISSHSSPPSGKVIPLECDVTSKSSLEAAASHIASATGYVNLVISNAGILGPNYHALISHPADAASGPLPILDAQAHLWATPIEDITEAYKINVAGALFTAVAFLGLLDKGIRKEM